MPTQEWYANRCQWYEDKIVQLETEAEVEVERLQAIVNDCLSRLQELEEVGQHLDGSWYWRSCGDTVGGEAAEAKGK